MEQAVATAERIGDPALTGHVLRAKAAAHVYCREPEAALEAGEHALSLLPEEALADRADLTWHLLGANYRCGRFAEVVRLIPVLEGLARRIGRRELLVWGGVIHSEYQLHLTGDLRAYLEHMDTLRHTAQQWWHSRFLVAMAMAHLHLGDTEDALAKLASAVAEPTLILIFKGVAEAMLFSATALAGSVVDARMLFRDVEPWLPAVGKRSIAGTWVVLDASVPGLMLTDDIRCGTLYPSCVSYLGTGVIEGSSIVPGNPQTVAGIAAHAAGLRDRARDHFETAIRQADELPHRLLQPTARYWYGRLLVDDPHPAEQARGRAMIEAAETDFRSLEMVTYANLAEQSLRQ
jgi:hypothetical protein